MHSVFKPNSSNADEPRLIDQINIVPNEPVDLAVLAVKKTGIRCKHISSGLPVTYRRVRREIEGEIITVMPSNVWQFKKTVYLTGATINQRMDITTLKLVPLRLEEKGMFDPDEEADLFETEDPFAKYYRPIKALGQRREYEMEQIIPFEDSDDIDDDPITMAVEAYEIGDYSTAHKIIKDVLAEDLRCIDAHVHLGNWEFNFSDTPNKISEDAAKRHYEVGIGIARLTLGTDFHDLLPWDHLDNRPYLRCMHGLGLCLWRGGNLKEARELFEKILLLNPRDNQGVRLLLADIDAGKDWYSATKIGEGAL